MNDVALRIPHIYASSKDYQENNQSIIIEFKVRLSNNHWSYATLDAIETSYLNKFK